MMKSNRKINVKLGVKTFFSIFQLTLEHRKNSVKLFVQNYSVQGEFCDEVNWFATTFDLVVDLGINIGVEYISFSFIFPFENDCTWFTDVLQNPYFKMFYKLLK